MREEIPKVRKLLFEDVFLYFERMGCPDERHRYIKTKGVMKNAILAKIANLTVPMFQKYAVFRTARMAPTGIKVLFYADPTTYSHIIHTLVEHANVIINNPLRCLPISISKIRNIIFLPLFLFAASLVDGILKNQDKLIFQSLVELRSILLKTAPDIIILNDAIYPINRALILVAKELGIPTVEIQHAVYPFDMRLTEGLSADYVFVWGDFFKQMYLDQKIGSSDSIKILGYPCGLEPIPVDPNKKKITVYYLAQGFQYMDIKNLDILLENALRLKKISDQNDLQFRCRLHPNSPAILLNKILPRVKCTPKGETLVDSIKSGDVFISFNSTSLIQAALNGKHCIQLKNIPVVTDDFERLGICPKTFDTIDELEPYLKGLAKVKPCELKQFYKPVNPRYIEIPKPNPGERFLELMQDIICNKG